MSDDYQPIDPQAMQVFLIASMFLNRYTGPDSITGQVEELSQEQARVVGKNAILLAHAVLRTTLPVSRPQGAWAVGDGLADEEIDGLLKFMMRSHSELDPVVVKECIVSGEGGGVRYAFTFQAANGDLAVLHIDDRTASQP